MVIESVINSLKTLIEFTRKPASAVPSILLICSMARRPGLSTLLSFANVSKAMEKLGLPTGTMPDGSQNKMMGMIYSVLSEVHRSIREDGRVECSLFPGSLLMGGVGAGTNVNTGKIYGLFH